MKVTDKRTIADALAYCLVIGKISSEAFQSAVNAMGDDIETIDNLANAVHEWSALARRFAPEEEAAALERRLCE